MKRQIIAVCIITGAVSTFAQGTILFNNLVANSVVAPIYSPDPAAPWIGLHGNTVNGFPAGTTVYGGSGLTGFGYTVQLWGTPGADKPMDSLQPATGYSAAYFHGA